jgi:reactive chlorine resistance protein C
MYSLGSVDAVSRTIGTTELFIALLIALRPISAVASATGSLLAVLTFLTTLSFMLSTPGVWEPAFPALSGLGALLIKDVGLLACAAVTAGEALVAAARKGTM